MKICVIFGVLMTLCHFGYAAQATPNPAQNTPLPLQGSCLQLQDQEKAFALNLSAVHQAIFCQLFGPDQRVQAMAYINASSLNKATGMTSDMAVEMALKNCRGLKTLPQAANPPAGNDNNGRYNSIPQKKRGSCTLTPKN